MSKKSAKKMKAAKSSAHNDQEQGGEIETVAPGDELKYVGRTGTVFIIDDQNQIRAAIQAGKRSATKRDKKMVPNLKKGEDHLRCQNSCLNDHRTGNRIG